MPYPAPRRLGLRRSAEGASPAGHDSIVAAKRKRRGAWSPRRTAFCSSPPDQTVVTGALSVMESPVLEVTCTVARPLPGEAPETVVCHVAVPVASVLPDAVMGPSPWI